MILSIDLASRFSAAVKLTDAGIAWLEFDSLFVSPFDFVDEIGARAQNCELIIIEDVPYGISNQKMIKNVLRLQGAIMLKLCYVDMLEKTVFVNPATWQRAMGVYGEGKSGAHDLAVTSGFKTPDLLARYAHELDVAGAQRSKLRAQLRKAATDYDDAFLMGLWALRNLENIRDISGVQEPMI